MTDKLKEQLKEEWIEEFDKRFLTDWCATKEEGKLYIEVGSQIKTSELKYFISSLLKEQREEIVENMKLELRSRFHEKEGYIHTDIFNDIINLIKQHE